MFANPDRVHAVCQDIVDHYLAGAYRNGLKAQVVAFNRELAVAYADTINELLAGFEASQVLAEVGRHDRITAEVNISVSDAKDEDDEVTSLNESVKQLFEKLKLADKDVRSNYQLVGAVWFNTPRVDFTTGQAFSDVPPAPVRAPGLDLRAWRCSVGAVPASPNKRFQMSETGIRVPSSAVARTVRVLCLSRYTRPSASDVLTEIVELEVLGAGGKLRPHLPVRLPQNSRDSGRE